MFVEYDCEICGNLRRVRRANGSSRAIFCSVRCKAQVQRMIRGTRHPRWKHRQRTKICASCGGMFSHKGQTQGIEGWLKRKYCSQKCGPGYKFSPGEKHPLWKGGVEGSMARGGRRRRDHRQTHWSKSILRRDDFTCRRCGKRGGDLHAHHVLSFIDHVEERWNIDNGITLCKPCHYRSHSAVAKEKQGEFGGRLSGEQPKVTPSRVAG